MAKLNKKEIHKIISGLEKKGGSFKQFDKFSVNTFYNQAYTYKEVICVGGISLYQLFQKGVLIFEDVVIQPTQSNPKGYTREYFNVDYVEID